MFWWYSQGTNSEFTLRLEDVSGAFEVEPKSATGSTSVSIRVSNGSLDYENPNQRKFIILVSNKLYMLRLNFEALLQIWKVKNLDKIEIQFCKTWIFRYMESLARRQITSFLVQNVQY